MKYSELLKRLESLAEPDFAQFQRKLIPTKQEIMGVRTPIMRKIAKECERDADEVIAFPDTYYEVTFIKLSIVASFPYERFVAQLPYCVDLIDNWATCDCFKAKCIQTHRDEFLPVLENIFSTGNEFSQRYVLVTLLSYYVDERYIPTIENYLLRADTSPYYVHMGAAWLISEVLVKYYDHGVELLKKGVIDVKTHNRSIQKAIESYRLTHEQKEFLRSLKIKK